MLKCHLVNPGLLEKLLIISWNCWVRIMNEMETLSTFSVFPLLASYFGLSQSQITHSSEILHTLTNTYCNISLGSHNMLCHTPYTFQREAWTEQNRKMLDYHWLLKANFHLKTFVYSSISSNTCILFALLRWNNWLSVRHRRKTTLILNIVYQFPYYSHMH